MNVSTSCEYSILPTFPTGSQPNSQPELGNGGSVVVVFHDRLVEEIPGVLCMIR